MIEVHTRLDGESRAGEQTPVVVRLVVVHVHAVAVDFHTEVVAGAVQDVRAVPGRLQHLARGPVHLPAAQRRPLRGGLLDQVDGGIPRAGDRVEGLGELVGHARAGEAHPGDIGVNGAGRTQLAPQIQQHQFVTANRPAARGRRHVVRVARVLHGSHDRRRIGEQPLFLEPADHQLLDVVLGDRAARPDALGDCAERAILDPVERVRGLEVGRQGVGIPQRREALHEVAGGDHVHAAAPDRLHGAGVDAGQVRVRVLGRVFHRDAGQSAHEAIQPRREGFTAGVDVLAPRQPVERGWLDGMHQRPGFSGGGHHVVPAARGHLARAVQTRQAARDRVGSVEVVEKPAVEAVFGKRRLHGGDVQRHSISIRSRLTPTPGISPLRSTWGAGPGNSIGTRHGAIRPAAGTSRRASEDVK